ncbi:hypothetical protein JHK82_042524 [Glycine max]|nr:hypothetical protein JHK85_043185 [Glycine max]KAG5105554.1 hypothetical protein JHK82_042524 [Glycine max]KAG5116664.1 hypothetical protein JHK84_042777 [Glycine max]
MDTSSDILWIMCNHVGLLFDPSKSSTFSPLCKTPCGFKGCKCDPIPFNISYVDKSSTSGTFGSDTVVFETTDEGHSQIFDVLVRCGHNIGFNTDPGYNGIRGLNNGPNSLATKIGQKFSYCVGNLADPYYNYNQLILCEGADLEGYSTPFEVHHGFYYVTLKGIIVGEKRLDIAPITFEIKGNNTGGVIRDSGTTITYLVDMVTFHFADGADLALDTGSFFNQLNSILCMTVSPASILNTTISPSVIELLAQQSYNVGYDLVNQFCLLPKN